LYIKKILITGGIGYLGQYIVNYYLERGFALTLIIRSVTIVPEYFEGKLDVIYLEDANFDNKIRSLKVDCFINAAVEYGRGINSESDVIWCNTLFPIKILNLLETTSDFCFISFDSFYSKTLTFNKSLLPAYVLSKKTLVDWLSLYNMKKGNKIVILSIEHLIGPNESISKFNGWFIQQCKLNSEEIQLTDGLQIRDFVFVDDVVGASAIILENCHKLKNIIYKFEVGSGKVTV
jgi:CDP-paratose synthetase